MKLGKYLEELNQGRSIRRSSWGDGAHIFLSKANNLLLTSSTNFRSVVTMDYKDLIADDWEIYKEYKNFKLMDHKQRPEDGLLEDFFYITDVKCYIKAILEKIEEHKDEGFGYNSFYKNVIKPIIYETFGDSDDR